MFEIDRQVCEQEVRRNEADLTGGMGQDTGKNEKTVNSPHPLPLNKRNNRAKQQAGIPRHLSPHGLRHFLLTWLKKQGSDDALIQPYSARLFAQFPGIS
ncbi:hypothetical protein NYE69_27370 [Paenibacillus sp. FSL R5-0527]|uniref:tyrosine-type recombinase/integrase n=1 Tax=Paenibacillus sp. FSL R5-0527 TaxID=2975321 RepID=UPI0026C5C51B